MTDRADGLAELERRAPRLAALVREARALPPLRVAVAGAEEPHVLEAVIQAHAAGLLDPVLVAPRESVDAACRALGLERPPFEVADAGSDAEAARAAVGMVLDGAVEALVKGLIHTDELMHPVLEHLRTGRRVSHVFIAELASYHKLLYITDAAINIAPDLETKAAIAQNAVDLARLLGVSRPLVAALSAVEVVKSAIPSTIDAACLAKMADRGQIRNAVVDGPLAFDNAISRQAAEIKRIVSPVPGEVDVLLVPDLNAGNILAKDLEYLAGAILAGIVVGARVPVMLPSRSDPVPARIASAAVASLLVHRGGLGAAAPAAGSSGTSAEGTR